MNTFMRSAVRRASVGLGALALAAGAAACGGGDEQEPAPEDPGVEDPAGGHEDPEPSDGGGEQPGQTPSDGGGMVDGEEDTGDGEGAPEGEDGAAAGELSSSDLDAATERFIEFIQAVDDHDAETACSIMLNPETGQTGAEDPECVEIFEEDVAPAMPAGALEHLDASMIEAEDNGDGKVTIILEGNAFPMPMGQGDDGAWYVTGAV